MNSIQIDIIKEIQDRCLHDRVSKFEDGNAYCLDCGKEMEVVNV